MLIKVDKPEEMMCPLSMSKEKQVGCKGTKCAAFRFEIFNSSKYTNEIKFKFGNCGSVSHLSGDILLPQQYPDEMKKYLILKEDMPI